MTLSVRREKSIMLKTIVLSYIDLSRMAVRGDSIT